MFIIKGTNCEGGGLNLVSNIFAKKIQKLWENEIFLAFGGGGGDRARFANLGDLWLLDGSHLANLPPTISSYMSNIGASHFTWQPPIPPPRRPPSHQYSHMGHLYQDFP